MSKLAEAIREAIHQKSHALKSASGGERWLNCPGSVALSYGEARTSSTYAEEGETYHWVSETCLLENMEARQLIGKVWEAPSGRRYTVDAENAAHAQVYIDLVRALVAKYEGVLFVEKTISLSAITGEQNAPATPDVYIISEKHNVAIVVDLKFGRGKKVYAFKNGQGILYHGGAMDTYGLSYDFDTIEQFGIFICQPRVSREPSEWWMTRKQLDWELSEFSHQALVVDEAFEVAGSDQSGREIARYAGREWENTYLNPGSHCDWCAARTYCPKLERVTTEEIASEFYDLTAVEPDPAKPIKVKKADVKKQLKEINNERLGRVAALLPMFQTFADAILEEAYARAMAGEKIPFHKLVKSKGGHRYWADNDRAAIDISREFTDAERLDIKLKSPAQMEDLYGKEERWNRVKQHVIKPEGGLSLVHESDKREEQSAIIDAEFRDCSNDDLL